MNMTYKFTLTYGGVEHHVHPIYKDDLSIDYEKESQQMFFREKLTGNIVFVGTEANAIIAQSFNTEFILKIYNSTTLGTSWTLMHTSHFYMTDCTIDADNQKVTVKPNVKDRYNAILDGLEKEFNLIELLPVTEQIDMHKRALLQLYSTGEDKITNVFGSYSWEQDCDFSNNSPEDFGFFNNKTQIILTFDNAPRDLQAPFYGWVQKYQGEDNGWFTAYNSERVYHIYRYHDGNEFVTDIRDTDNTVYWHQTQPDPVFHGQIVFIPTEEGEAEGFTMIAATPTYKYYYMRWLCDVESFEDNGTTYQTAWLEPNDPNYGGNLHYCIGWNQPDVIVSTNNYSSTPTEWGKMTDNLYYDVPDNNHYFVPIGRSNWGDESVWYVQDALMTALEGAMRKKYVLRDAYPLWSVIDVLLQKIDASVTFAGTSTYSQFFYGASNPIYAAYEGKPYITPKSNITAGEYTQPAMQAPITLAMVFGMLAKAYKCYWFIDDNNRLRIEHIKYFKNGGSYSYTPQVGIDLTDMINPRNGKPWSLDTKMWQYDKEDLPARYQYEWMDDVTEIFDGWPYEIVSQFVKTDKVEEISISNFTSDVDYMQIAPNNVSKDGFALLMPTVFQGRNQLPIVQHSIWDGNVQRVFTSQNWWASLQALQTYFLKYDLPSKAYKWRTDSLQTSPDIKRAKRQTVNIPLMNHVPEVMKLVHTTIGDGQIQKMTLNLSSRIAKTTLVYDTY